MKELKVGFSSCPNDTFAFHAMLHGCVDTGSLAFSAHIHDVETLNVKAATGEFEVTKLSFAAYLHLKDSYEMLDSGAALGFGCGPLVVAGNSNIPLAQARVAVPGDYTTAHLLLKLWNPDIRNVEMVSFEKILPGIESGRYDAGVIIHEGRFVYQQYGCTRIVDLGEWWEMETGLPIPLGCIAIRRDPATLAFKQDVERIIRDSIQYAFDHPAASRQFVKKYAQEMDDEVINSHIALYVNDFSLSLGSQGGNAVKKLEEMARCRGIL